MGIVEYEVWSVKCRVWSVECGECEVWSVEGRRSALDMAMFILCVRRSTLDVSCCLIFANRIVGAVSSGDDVQTAWQAWDVRLFFCVADAACGEDPSCVERHFS